MKMSKEKFLYRWNPDYTINRKLRDYTGDHPKTSPIPAHEWKDADKPEVWWSQYCMEIINAINLAIEDLAASGYHSSTLRQLYYKLVGQNLIPNHMTVYKSIGDIVTNAKYCGIIEWDAIEDRGRSIAVAWYERSVEDALENTASQYRLDRQDGQKNDVLVMAEKDAVSNILAPECNKYSVRYCINKGYASSSLIYRLYKKQRRQTMHDKKTIILYFGDHDPSGLNMISDIQNRVCHMLCTGMELDLVDIWDEKATDESWDYYQKVQNVVVKNGKIKESVFIVKDFNEPVKGKVDERTVYFYSRKEAEAAAYIYHELVRVIPVALTISQVREYNLPPNPAKTTDSRSAKYIEEFGHESWELDAIPHEVLARLVREAIEKHINMDTYKFVLNQEEQERKTIKSFIDTLNNDE